MKSWFVGDSGRDLECAKNAGVQPVLVQTGAAGRDVPSEVQPVFTAPDAPGAIAEILQRVGLAVSDSMLPAPNSPLQ